MAVRTRSLMLLFLALASGVAAAWLSLSYLRRETQPLLNPAAAAGKGVVAAKDLPVGAVLTEADLRVVDWPGDAVPAGLIANPQEAIGRGLMASVRLNEPLLDSKLAPRGSGGGLAVIIEPGKRALSLRVDDIVGVAGFVQPNSRVDILLTMNSGTGTALEPTTKAILQNIEALAIGQTTQTNAQGQAQVVPVVTVLVSPEQAETLALASSQGRLQMAMRNQLDTLPIKTDGARVSALLGPVRPARQPPTVLGYRRGGNAVVSPRAPATEETIVEGFRGGERSITRFTRPKPPEDRDNK